MTIPLHDLIRSLVTTSMLVILLFTLAQPKFKNKIQISAMLLIICADLAVNIYFYLQNDYSTLAKIDIVFFIIMGICIKPLFKDSIMQWIFNCITTMNIYGVIVILSYYLCNLFPYPYYAITILRFMMFGVTIWMFYKRLRPLYQSASQRWNIYILASVGIFANIVWYFIESDDVVNMFETNFVSLLLLVVLAIFIYIANFYSLNKQKQENEMREENLKLENDKKLFELNTKTMEQRLKIMDETVKQMSMVQHDRRHFNIVLLEILTQGKIDEAIKIINKQTDALPIKPQRYCENIAVNAVISYWVNIAEQQGILCNIKLNIPQKLLVDDLELSMIISNLLENAIKATYKNIEKEKRYINLTAVFAGQIIIEIENPYDGKIEIDEKGYPISKSEGHGMGTKSIVSFVEKNKGNIIYDFSNEIFKVRIIA